MKKINPDVFIRNRKPEEVIVGISAGKYKQKPEVFSKVVKRFQRLSKNLGRIHKISQKFKFKKQNSKNK
jgi:hypothetical protein